MKRRYPKITKSARDQHCTARVPGVCNWHIATTVFAHAPCVDKGMGLKGPDWWGAYCCSNCHDWLDGRLKSEYANVSKQQIWLAAIYETQKLLLEAGLLQEVRP